MGAASNFGLGNGQLENKTAPTANMEVRKELGKRLKEKRKEYDYTQQSLAEKLEVNKKTIENVENGRNATIEMISLVANEFGLKLCFCEKDQ